MDRFNGIYPRDGAEEDFVTTHELHRNRKVQVNVSCCVLTPVDIDHKQQTFSLQFYLRLTWRETRLRGVSEESVNWSEQWDPRIVLLNAVHIYSKSETKSLEYDKRSDIPWVVNVLRVNGTFKASFDLANYPIDYQELPIHISSEWTQQNLQFQKDNLFRDRIFDQTTEKKECPEWEICPSVLVEGEQMIREPGTDSTIWFQHEDHIVKLFVKRKASFFLWNIFLVMGIITVLTFSTFGYRTGDAEERLEVTVLFFLILLVVYHFSIQRVVTIQATSLLDVFFLCCMSTQGLVAIQNAIVIGGVGRTLDAILAIAVAGIAIAVFIVFLLIILRKNNQRNRALNNYARQYSELCNDIEENMRRKNSRDRLLTNGSIRNEMSVTESELEHRLREVSVAESDVFEKDDETEHLIVTKDARPKTRSPNKMGATSPNHSKTNVNANSKANTNNSNDKSLHQRERSGSKERAPGPSPTRHSAYQPETPKHKGVPQGYDTQDKPPPYKSEVPQVKTPIHSIGKALVYHPEPTAKNNEMKSPSASSSFAAAAEQLVHTLSCEEKSNSKMRKSSELDKRRPPSSFERNLSPTSPTSNPASPSTPVYEYSV